MWVDPANPHNPMMDQIGRVWMTSQIRNRQNPAYCSGAGNKFGEYFPMAASSRQASYYDPKTKEFTLIDTCFSTHHLQFAEDDNNTLYFSGDRLAFGWIDTKKYDATKDEQASQGWCPAVLDTNGDGKITKPWNEPATGRGATAKPAAFDPARDTRVPIGTYSYGVVANPVDDSLWGVTDDYPGELFRFDAREQPAADLHHRAVHGAEGARLPDPRRRRRSQGRHLDGARVEQPAGELRSHEVPAP